MAEVYLPFIKARNEEQEMLMKCIHRIWDWDMAIQWDRLRVKAFGGVVSQFTTEDMVVDFVAYKQYLEVDKKINDYKKDPDRPWCLTVLGTVGNGKTHITRAAVDTYNRIYFPYKRDFLPAMYTTMGNMLDVYKDGFDSNYILKLSNKKLLVIDELRVGKSDMSDFNRGVLERVITNRYERKLTTILVGNLKASDIKNVFEEQIISRLREGLSISMNAPDMRKPGRL